MPDCAVDFLSTVLVVAKMSSPTLLTFLVQKSTLANHSSCANGAQLGALAGQVVPLNRRAGGAREPGPDKQRPISQTRPVGSVGILSERVQTRGAPTTLLLRKSCTRPTFRSASAEDQALRTISTAVPPAATPLVHSEGWRRVLEFA